MHFRNVSIFSEISYGPFVCKGAYTGFVCGPCVSLALTVGCNTVRLLKC